ncbi:MAG TPA: hypothetical protein VHI31_05990 [Actinomycetota bacterium]|nr:hypothetical protein [Actinomycetota bacterium]
MPVQNSGSRNFRISLKRGDSELRISAPDQAWVDGKLNELLGWLEPGESVQSQAAGQLKSDFPPAGKSPSLAEHVRAVGPSGGLEHVLAVGYYLERYSRLKGGFRRRDLAEAFKAVRYQHSNPGVPIATARRQGLLMDGEEHEKLLLTDTAERWVEERLGT